MRLPFVSFASILAVTCIALAGCSGETSSSGSGAGSSEADYSTKPSDQDWLHCLSPDDVLPLQVNVEAVHPARGAFGEVHGRFYASKIGGKQVDGQNMTVTRDGSTYTLVGDDLKVVITNVTSTDDGMIVPGATVTATTRDGASATFAAQCEVDFRSEL